MKKNYASPTIEKLAFRYRDQVVAASGAPIPGGSTCTVPDTNVLEIGQLDVCGYIGGQFGYVGAEV